MELTGAQEDMRLMVMGKEESESADRCLFRCLPPFCSTFHYFIHDFPLLSS